MDIVTTETKHLGLEEWTRNLVEPPQVFFSFLQLVEDLFHRARLSDGQAGREAGARRKWFFVAFHFSEQTCCPSWLSPSWAPPVCPWPQPWNAETREEFSILDNGALKPLSIGSLWILFLTAGPAVEWLLLSFPNSSVFWHSLLFCIRELFSHILALEIAISLMSLLLQLVCGWSPDISWLKSVSLVFFLYWKQKRLLHFPVS